MKAVDKLSENILDKLSIDFLRSQVLNFCSGSRRSHTEYQAGSIDTLVRVVDMNGGYTVIPELHLIGVRPYHCYTF